jgi:hypothetical protein
MPPDRNHRRSRRFPGADTMPGMPRPDGRTGHSPAPRIRGARLRVLQPCEAFPGQAGMQELSRRSGFANGGTSRAAGQDEMVRRLSQKQQGSHHMQHMSRIGPVDRPSSCSLSQVTSRRPASPSVLPNDALSATYATTSSRVASGAWKFRVKTPPPRPAASACSLPHVAITQPIFRPMAVSYFSVQCALALLKSGCRISMAQP